MDSFFFLAKALLVALAIFIATAVVLAIGARGRRGKEQGFEYIYVNDDGSARELDEDEIEYLSAEFQGGDGNRPYIKLNYEARTPDGKLRGYLRRRQLPKRIPIDSAGRD